MIAAAGAAEPSSAITMWVAVAGVPLLLLLVACQVAGRPLLPTRSAPFGRVPAGPLLLIAFSVYTVGMGSVALIISGAGGTLGGGIGLALLSVILVLAYRFALRPALRPQGTMAGRIAMGLVVAWASLPVIYGLMAIIQAVSGVVPQAHVDTILQRKEGWQWFVVMAIVVAPVLEEVTVRGLLYTGLRGAWGPRAALIISSVLFGLMHWEPPQVWAPLAVFGVFLAYLVEVTGSLTAPIVAHMAFNALTVGQLLAA